MAEEHRSERESDKETEKKDLAPELYNSEQDDESSQAQRVALDARKVTPDSDSSIESIKVKSKDGLKNDSSQDLIDHMRDMEQSGRIDMNAYRGEPNMDDEDGALGRRHDPGKNDL